jgi:hypothetical protein
VTDASTSPDDATLAGHDTVDTVETDIDLDAIEADLDGVERALRQLAEGTYWRDGDAPAPIESA